MKKYGAQQTRRERWKKTEIEMYWNKKDVLKKKIKVHCWDANTKTIRSVFFDGRSTLFLTYES